MNPATILKTFETCKTEAGTAMLLNTCDSEAIAGYEQMLYRSFYPILEKNPLLRELWLWDDTNQRLRTRVPYEAQLITVLTGNSPADVIFSSSANIRIDQYWQSGTYQFPRPDNPGECCEFLNMNGINLKDVNSYTLCRAFVHEYLFVRFANAGFRYGYATTADHLRAIYRWLGAEFVAEHTVQGYRRTLLRWDLGRYGGNLPRFQ